MRDNIWEVERDDVETIGEDEARALNDMRRRLRRIQDREQEHRRMRELQRAINEVRVNYPESPLERKYRGIFMPDEKEEEKDSILKPLPDELFEID